MSNLMSFQDFIDKATTNGNLALDTNRGNLNCINFNFSPEKISKITAFDVSSKKFKMLTQSEINELFIQLSQEESYFEKENIREKIFLGSRRLIHNYLIGRSKYDALKDEPVDDMIKDGENILKEAIDSYNPSLGNFSEYVFSLFADKTVHDIRSVMNASINKEDKKHTDYTLPESINVDSVISRLKGKSIILLKETKFKTNSNELERLENLESYDMNWDIDNFIGLDDYEITDFENDLEGKGKSK